jgi:hypothetical protein
MSLESSNILLSGDKAILLRFNPENFNEYD